MKCGIGLDESKAALAIILAALCFGEIGQLFQCLGCCSLCGSEFSGSAFNCASEFINVVQNLQRNLGNEVAAVRNDAQQPVILKPNCRFAHRRPTSLVATGKLLLAQRLTGLEKTVDDVALECGIYSVAQSGGSGTNQTWLG